jgi:hypothetical protein
VKKWEITTCDNQHLTFDYRIDMPSTKPISKRLKPESEIELVGNSPAWMTIDQKGRLCLGRCYANRPVLVKRMSETEINLKFVRVPASEAWLYQNPKALKSIKAGLAQARARRFAK